MPDKTKTGKHSFVPGAKLFSDTLCAHPECYRPRFHDVHSTDNSLAKTVQGECPGCVAAHSGSVMYNDRHTCEESKSQQQEAAVLPESDYKMLELYATMIDEQKRLEQLPALALIHECLQQNIADDLRVQELMNRVLPGYENIAADGSTIELDYVSRRVAAPAAVPEGGVVPNPAEIAGEILSPAIGKVRPEVHRDMESALIEALRKAAAAKPEDLDR